jgi:UrcA family protein
MKTMYRIFSALAALAMTAGTLALTTPAQAAPADEAVTISFDGLNPADPADAERIERRIRNAARSLCGSQLVQPVRLMQQAAECEKATLADARGSVEIAAARQGGPFRLTLRTPEGER